MSIPTQSGVKDAPIEYPDSDGEPLAENTKQLWWIVLIFGNLSALFRDQPDVFVAADLFWYPVEGHPGVRLAPDALVVFGRPKGHRGSYMQWVEGNIPLTVVFEVLSPKNTVQEMSGKFAFYEEYGVEEYYVYDPDTNHLTVYLRQGTALRRIRPVADFVSPRLGIRFDFSGEEMVIFGPDGQRFVTLHEEKLARQQAEQARERAEYDRIQAEQRAVQAEQERREAETRAALAEQRAEMSARLAALSRKARRGQASSEELQELESLEQMLDQGNS